jgi:glycosyltransferase involved in cell wall biosynthesis
VKYKLATNIPVEIQAATPLHPFQATMSRKILIIVQNQSVPPDPRVLNEARSLHASGYGVTVLSPRSKDWPSRYELIDGIRIYRHPAPREGSTAFGYLWEYAASLFWQILYTWYVFLRHGFDVIQGCNPPDNIVFVFLPFRLFKVKYIFDHHDASPELYKAKGGSGSLIYMILLWLERVTYRYSDVIIATNGSYKGLAVGRGHRSPEDVFIVRNGPDPDAFRPVPPNETLRRGRPYLIGYVGCMNYQDGLDILVEVADLLRSAGRTDVSFVCVGGGPELPTVRQMVEDRHLGGMVNFTGRVPDADLLEALSTADICVNPDRPCQMNDMSTMIKIMEYMALGKPIVQFESSEGRFSAGEASLYADAADPIRSFADKIVWLLEHPEERKRMGEIGRKRVEEELAWQHSVPHLLAAYERALGSGTRQLVCTPTVTDTQPGAVPDYSSRGQTYVLVTPARNESLFIEETIRSVIHQTVLPLKWVIVDDGSTDDTAAIVKRYLPHHPWIELVELPQRRDRNFAAKVGAFNAGYERLPAAQWDVIGNLDADITFDPKHFEFLMNKFAADSRLGVAGTVFREQDYRSDTDSFEGRNHVPGACQLFRRTCWEDIGGYIPNRAGGIDWVAVTTARMRGWKTESFRERWFFHNRRLGTAECGVLSSLFSYGKKDYSFGGHPVWEIFRVLYRCTRKPIIAGGVALGFGYLWAFVSQAPRPVSRELIDFHRKEQITKLGTIIKALLRFKSVDTFTLAQD